MLTRFLEWTGLAPIPPKTGSREAVWAIFAYLSFLTCSVLIGGWFSSVFLPPALTFLGPFWVAWFGFAGYVYKMKDSKTSPAEWMGYAGKSEPIVNEAWSQSEVANAPPISDERDLQ